MPTTIPSQSRGSPAPRAGTAIILAGILAVACGAATVQTTLSLRDADCSSCAAKARAALLDTPGVRDVQVHTAKAELTVEHDPIVAPADRLLVRARAAGVDPVLGAGRGSYRAEAGAWPPGADVQHLGGDGAERDVFANLPRDRVAVIDFWAPWCKPCREVTAHLQLRLREGAPFAVRKVNVVDWDTPIARQYLSDVASLPYVIVIAPGGKRVAISGLHLDRLDAALASAGAGPPAEPPAR